MRICPQCKAHKRALEKRVQDEKTKKHWLITYCGSCHYNFNLEESKGGSTPKQELEKPWTPPPLDWNFHANKPSTKDIYPDEYDR